MATSVMMVLDLRDEWAEMAGRRPALAEVLSVFGGVVDRWAAVASDVPPLRLSAAEGRGCWERGEPLIEVMPPALPREAVEDLLAPLMDDIAARRPAAGPSLHRFAEAWDEGAIGPADLLPARGRLGRVPESVWFDPPLLAFFAVASLRPFLEAYLAEARQTLSPEDGWGAGACPFCGAPAGFADVIEGGARRLACHLCGGAWPYPRLACPACGEQASARLVRLAAEGAEEGYAVLGCTTCRGYVKELDRRVRWNGQSALVEDWGSPHLDLVARRQGFGRALPSLLDLADLG